MRTIVRALLVGALAFVPATPAHAIINGKQIMGNDWAFMVAIGCSPTSTKSTCADRKYGNTADGMYSAQFCAGTLIAPTVVVTAAHCLHHDSGQLLAAADLVVGGGTASLKSMSGARVTTVLNVLEDPQYDAASQVHDLAILKLAKSIPDSTSIGWLPTVTAELTRGGLPVEVAGWGDVLPIGLSPNAAQFAQFPMYSQEQCSRELGASFNAALMLCGTAQTSGGWIDTCQGDSGGPLTATVNGLRLLIGVISWGGSCAKGTPGVYTNIATTLPALLSTFPPSAPIVKPGIKSLTVVITGEAWMSGAWAVLAEHNLKLSTCGIVLTAFVTTSSCKLDGLTLGGTYVVRVVPPIGVVAPAPAIAVVKGNPAAPRITAVSKVSDSGNAVVTFAPRAENDAAVSTREVTCRSGSRSATARAFGQKLVLTSLARGVRYTCTARAINVYGVSVPSAVFVVGKSG